VRDACDADPWRHAAAATRSRGDAMRAAAVSYPRLRPSVTGRWTLPAAAVLASVVVGTLLVASTKRTLELVLVAAFAVATALLRREWLTGLALALFALVGAPYLGFPRTFGSYLSPAVLVLLVWAARTLAADGERRLPRRAWVAVAVGMS